MLAFVKAFLAAGAAMIAASMFRGCGPLPTPTLSPTATPTASVASTPIPFPDDAPLLTIAHTNDVRGEVDPCG